MKILNLYAGIGGNRKLWTDVEVTAIENNPDIAKIYQDFFPNDKVIVTDAHQYLLEHYKEFDFIWSSPPCPTHTRFNYLNDSQNKKHHYPEMNLYQEVIYLMNWFRGKYCVENVISYYKPLIPSIESGNHYYWTNFYFKPLNNCKRGIRGQDNEFRKNRVKFDIDKYNLPNAMKQKILRNCVEPEHGLHIFKSMNNQELKLVI